MSRATAGSTLIELAVVLVILGILSGISAVAIWSLTPPPADPMRSVVEKARVNAIESGHTVLLKLSSAKAPLLFLPDGRVRGEHTDAIAGLPESTWNAP